MSEWGIHSQDRNKDKEAGGWGRHGSMRTNPALPRPGSPWASHRTDGRWSKTVRVETPASQRTGCDLYETAGFLSASVSSLLTWNNPSASCLRHMWALNKLIHAKCCKKTRIVVWAAARMIGSVRRWVMHPSSQHVNAIPGRKGSGWREKPWAYQKRRIGFDDTTFQSSRRETRNTVTRNKPCSLSLHTQHTRSHACFHTNSHLLFAPRGCIGS